MKLFSYALYMLTLLAAFLPGCLTVGGGQDKTYDTAMSAVAHKADDLLIVDCMLPGQVRKLGRMTYMTQRRPVRTTAIDCQIRGGEYVAYDRAGYDEALRAWLPLANEGDKVAQNNVGEIYMNGLAGDPEYDMAATWFKRSADQNYERARLNLGYLYEKGLGVPKDSVKALNLYRVATGLDEDIVLESEGLGAAERQEMDRLRDEVRRLREETRSLKQRLDQTTEQRDQSLMEHRRQMERLATEREDLEGKQRELDRLKAELAADKSARPAPSSADPKEVERLKKDLAARQAELEAQRKRADDLEAKIASLDEQARSYQQKIDRNIRAAGLQEQLEKQRAETERLENQLDLAGLEKEELTAKLTIQQRQLDTRKSELEDTRRELADAKSQGEKADSAEILRLETELSRRETQLQAEQKKTQLLSSKLVATENDLLQYGNKLEELEQLKVRMESKDAENKELRALLTETRQEKARLAEEFAWKKEHLEAERRGMEKARAAFENQRGEIDSSRRERLEQLEAEVARRQQEIEKQKNEAEFLRSRAEQLGRTVQEYQKKLDAYEEKMENLAGPSIEILDPTLAATRGKDPEAAVAPGVDKLEIIGKVDAPAGLYALKINERNQAWNDDGLFKATLPAPKEQTQVKVTAVDKRGRVGEMIFMLSPRRAQTEASLPKVDFGRYYALIIGNNDYKEFPGLQTPTNDAKDMESLLKEKYGFETQLLLNATRFDILTSLDHYRTTLTEKDNFLIYYAGHGELDEQNRRGYWLPVDASAASHVNSIPNYAVTDILNTMSVRQAIIVADTCYSGSLTRSAVARQTAGMSPEKRLEWLKKIGMERSRTVLSSGGLKPILDAGPGNHSVFARALLDILVINEDILEAGRLYREIRAEVTEASRSFGLEQIPQYAANIHAGHKAGDFLFVPKKYQAAFAGSRKAPGFPAAGRSSAVRFSLSGISGEQATGERQIENINHLSREDAR